MSLPITVNRLDKECEKHVKKIAIITLAVMLLIPITSGLPEKPKPSYLKRSFELDTYDVASHVIAGEVIKVESKWENTSKSNLIYTYATIKTKSYEKGFGKDEIVVKYMGGQVGNIGQAVFYTPHGVIEMQKDQNVLVFANQQEKDGVYKTWYVKHLKKKNINSLENQWRDLTPFGGNPDEDFGFICELTTLDDVYEIHDEGFVFMGNRHWDTDEFPLVYEINAYGTSDCTGEYSAVQDAFDTWEDVSSCELTFDYDGTTLDELSQDGNNVVDWETENGESWVGLNTYWYLPSGEVIESDIVANDKYEFCIGYVSGEYDVQNLMTHEVGHYIVLWDLWDSDNSAKTMYHEVDTYQCSRRSLHSGDRDGARYVYPD